MTMVPKARNSQAGFALVVVLSMLLVATMLFATVQSRRLAELRYGATDRLILERQLQNEDILRLAMALRLSEPDTTSFSITLGGVSHQVSLQDVGGRVDLNSASPELLDRLARSFGIDEVGMTKFRTWRQVPNRLLSVADFLRLTELPVTSLVQLTAAATVHSGRVGVARDHATLEAFRIVSEFPNAPSVTPAAILQQFVSEPNGINFIVLAESDGRARALGVIELGGFPGGRIVAGP
jgi:hypothetical protein